MDYFYETLLNEFKKEAREEAIIKNGTVTRAYVDAVANDKLLRLKESLLSAGGDDYLIGKFIALEMEHKARKEKDKILKMMSKKKIKSGESFEDMGIVLRCTKSNTQSVFSKAMKKISTPTTSRIFKWYNYV